MLTLYRILLGLALPGVLVRLAWRAMRAPGYGARPLERFGVLASSVPEGAIWVHTVSAGETIGAVPVIRALRASGARDVLVTTMTATGAAQARAAFADTVHHAWAPYDYPRAVARFLERVRPAALVLMETELWPNWLLACRERGIPVVLANARLSERSLRRYAALGGAMRDVIGCIDAVLCQAPEHARRFRALGAGEARVTVTGSVKFDAAAGGPDAVAFAAACRRDWHAEHRAVWIAASTHEGEERAALDAHAQVREQPGLADALLVLVPRHPERFDSAFALASSRFTACRRGDALCPDGTAVVVVDTMGELAGLYPAADVAFVGGSLVPVGGHNPIEPAAAGLPVLMGPHVHDVPELARTFAAAGALRIVADAGALSAALVEWLRDPVARARAGDAGRGIVERNRGATGRVVQAVLERLPALPRRTEPPGA